MKKNNKFKKFLKKYIIALVILAIIFWIYVFNTLKTYEKNQVDNYMEATVAEIKNLSKKGKISKEANSINVKPGDFEKNNASIEQGLKDLFNSECETTYKLNSSSTDEFHPIYDVFVNNNKVFEVKLDGSKVVNRLSLLTFSKWKVDSIDVKAENGLRKYEISIPSDYKVYVNDKLLTSDQISNSEEDKGLNEISKYVSIPFAVKYEVTGLINEPSVVIKDSKGKEVSYDSIKVNSDFKTYKTESEAKKEINDYPDVQKVAETWSLFLSNDLTGTRHGLATIGKYLINKSSLYNYAYSWATNVDITFISNHTLKNPAFTNEEIKNFTIYNENAFSCEVYLEKNMRLANGNDMTDKMHERLFFAYYDDTDDNNDNPTWKLVNMQSITKK